MNITENNYQVAYDAIRDILFLFVDMIESYEGFGHNVGRGKFKALDFIDAQIIEPEGYTFSIDSSLLCSGSAIALLCELSDAWDEYETWDVNGWPSIHDIKKANEEGRFNCIPEIQKAVSLGFGRSEEAFREQLAKVYKIYVRGYFNRLVENS